MKVVKFFGAAGFGLLSAVTVFALLGSSVRPLGADKITMMFPRRPTFRM
jgi:hypothetical protein